MSNLRLFAIDNSITYQNILLQELTQRLPPGSQVEHAVLPKAALEKLTTFKPTVIILNFALGSLLVNQEKFLPLLVKKFPNVPIIAYGVLDAGQTVARVLGAATYMKKPGAGQPVDDFYDHLTSTILEYHNKTPDRTAAAAATSAFKTGHTAAHSAVPAFPAITPPPAAAIDYTALRSNAVIDLIAMGASTGGTEALSVVIHHLKPPLPGIVIVQHIPPMFSRLFAERLNSECELTIKEAASGDIVKPNHIYIAPGAKHMTVSRTGGHYTLDCQPGPPVHSVCPSVDVLFDSVAAAAGNRAMGIIFTGIGQDGAAGLLKMRQLGSPTIGQDAETSTVYGMPRAAFEMGAVQQQLPLQSIPEAILKIVK